MRVLHIWRSRCVGAPHMAIIVLDPNDDADFVFGAAVVPSQ